MIQYAESVMEEGGEESNKQKEDEEQEGADIEKEKEGETTAPKPARGRNRTYTSRVALGLRWRENFEALLDKFCTDEDSTIRDRALAVITIVRHVTWA